MGTQNKYNINILETGQMGWECRKKFTCTANSIEEAKEKAQAWCDSKVGKSQYRYKVLSVKICGGN